MSTQAWDALLEAYLDGELSWFRRQRLERRLRRSPELQARLEELTAWTDLVSGAVETPLDLAPHLDLFSEIAPQLSAIDRAVEGEGPSAARSVRSGSRWLGWPSVAAAGVLAVLLLTTLSGLLDGELANVMEAASGRPVDGVERGALRYLNTDGRPVMVSQDGEDTTIIWLMDRPAGSV